MLKTYLLIIDMLKTYSSTNDIFKLCLNYVVKNMFINKGYVKNILYVKE